MVVVDALEVIQIDEEQGQPVRHLPGSADRRAQVALEAVAVEQGGQAVMIGPEFIAGRPLMQFGHIQHGADETTDTAALVP